MLKPNTEVDGWERDGQALFQVPQCYLLLKDNFPPCIPHFKIDSSELTAHVVSTMTPVHLHQKSSIRYQTFLPDSTTATASMRRSMAERLFSGMGCDYILGLKVSPSSSADHLGNQRGRLEVRNVLEMVLQSQRTVVRDLCAATRMDGDSRSGIKMLGPHLLGLVVLLLLSFLVRMRYQPGWRRIEDKEFLFERRLDNKHLFATIYADQS